MRELAPSPPFRCRLAAHGSPGPLLSTPRSPRLLPGTIRRAGIRDLSADFGPVPRPAGLVLPPTNLGQPLQSLGLVAEQGRSPVGDLLQARDRIAGHVVDGFEVAGVDPVVDREVDGLVQRQPPLADERGRDRPYDQKTGDFSYVPCGLPQSVRTFTGAASGGV